MAIGSRLDLSKIKNFNHRFEVARGVLEEECRKVLRKFFKAKRK